MRSVLLLFAVALLFVSCKEEEKHKIHLEDYNHPANASVAIDQKVSMKEDSTATKKTVSDSATTDSTKKAMKTTKKDSAS